VQAMTIHILTVSCPDRPGIVHALSGALLGMGGNILENAQFGDTETGLFTLRTRFEVDFDDRAKVREALAPVLAGLGGEHTLRDERDRPRMAILVSGQDHCLVDLLYRWNTGQLAADIPLVISNHTTGAHHAARYGVRFEHLPVTPDIKDQQEARLVGLIEDLGIDLVVLARYMQVLSPAVCDRWRGRAINIHHSFLPGFKGARPYHQAHARGVKLIGATAHYVTPDLDEGPIIEQDVERVDHTMSVQELTTIGQDIERRVLSRAVRSHIEDRVVLVGSRTVVFA
jgi:formyltetrahydrofolate deformylase